MALERLHLMKLPNMKGFFKDQESKEAFPNLKELQIERCSSLILPPLSSLQKLNYLKCSSSTLALFSEQQNTLTSLTVIIEENMACFPIEMVVKFTNLRSLTVQGAKEISVTGEGLQALKKLGRFGIEDCGTMRCLPEGLLQHLTALTSLHVSNCREIVELPEEIKHLRNLMNIVLFFLPKMECLPEALQYLSSLRSLNLCDLHEMESLPDWLGQHASLHDLYLQHCPKLVSLPPLPNLKYLHVNGCLELERRCQRGTGEDWHKIAHIRRLEIGC